MDELLARLHGDPALAVAALAVLVLLAVVVLDVVWLVGRALHDAHLERVYARFWERLGKELVVAIGDPAAEVAWLARARAHPPAILRRCLDTYLTRTSGDFRDGVARIYRALGLLDRDLRLIRSWRWGVRMRALRRLATVVTPEHRQAIVDLFAEGGEMRLLVGQIVGRIGTPEDVVALLGTWRVTSRLGEYPVHVMIDAMAPEALRAVLPHWDRLASVEVQRIVLGTAARVVPSACRELLAAAARHPSMEIRIAACHAGQRMTTPESLALLLALAQDIAWEVRAQAVKALGAHRAAPAADALVAALSDPSFWVRQNAAAALGAHGPGGVRRLQDVAARSGDRYARDAAEHVLSDLALRAGAAAEPALPTGAPA